MNMNIAEIAKAEEDIIRKYMGQISKMLPPTKQESEELVRRAAFLVRHNYVKIIDYDYKLHKALFVVQDASLATVTLNLKDHSLNCSCAMKESLCRHRVAALFALYQYIDSLSNWLEQFRSRAQQEQMTLFKEERTPENWLRFVQNVYKRNLYHQQQMNPYLLDGIFNDMMEQIRKQQPLEREWQPLFDVFTHVSLLSHTWKHLSLANTEAAQSFYRRFIQDEIERLEVNVLAMSNKSRLFAFDPFYNSLKEMNHYFLLNQGGYVENRIEIYLLIWNHIFTNKRDREVELEKLSTARQYEDDLSIPYMKSIFLVMLDQTEALQPYLDEIEVKDLLSWIELARTAGLNQQEAVRKKIIETIIPFMGTFIQEYLAPPHRMSFVKHFDEERQGVELSEELEETLFAAYGKYGLQPYSQFLIRKKRFDDWSALHQLYPTSLAFLEICGLKTVVEERPSVLLSLYHSLIMEEINQKSRQHYKSAVRLMKKMKAVAKKSGKHEFWNQYVTTVRQNYKRMRALQEEIEKGNLML